MAGEQASIENPYKQWLSGCVPSNYLLCYRDTFSDTRYTLFISTWAKLVAFFDIASGELLHLTISVSPE
jgi:hypothetical protein